MSVTSTLITFLLSQCCQLFGSLQHSTPHCPLQRHTVSMELSAGFLTLSLCFSTLSSSPVLHSSPADNPGCFKVNSCKCIMKDGSGVINLKAMGDAEGFLGRLRAVSVGNTSVDTEILFSFSPCQHFSQPEDLLGGDCTSVAACLIVRYPGVSGHISHYINYGVHEGNEFHYNHTLKVLSVLYFGELKHKPFHTSIFFFIMTSRQSFSPVLAHRDQAGPLHIWVESPCACPNACTMGDLGLGTIFLILLSLSAAAYFILGSCALRPFRSNSGVQISPEHSVWCMICYLCSERRPRRRRCYADLTL
uniref:Uncharacterized protein n=1 Tax=Fundulus heteroclitus TaxID=8078 RepID=A0A3Q2R0U6_FUNHE